MKNGFIMPLVLVVIVVAIAGWEIYQNTSVTYYIDPNKTCKWVKDRLIETVASVEYVKQSVKRRNVNAFITNAIKNNICAATNKSGL